MCDVSAPPYCFDMHHVDPDEKYENVSALMGRRAPLALIRAELEKCVCLCAICHRMVTNGDIIIKERAHA
jgi:hypothetical protein